MRIRKNAAKLPRAERERYVNAVKALKADITTTLDDGTQVSRYDQLVALHLGVTTRFRNQTFIRDGAHSGPAFLPWHRKYLLVLEEQLRVVDSAVTILYWDWKDRAGTENIIFQDDFMGPSGNGNSRVGQVASGPFTRAEGWELIDEIHRRGVNTGTQGRDLLRSTFLNFNSLPSQESINLILGRGVFESTSFRRGFRPELEIGPHNRLHVWVGSMAGDVFGTMSGMSSPNDPIFFLHHGAVDWLWARWQDDGRDGPDFYPESHSRVGHALRDPMWPWDGGQATTLDFIQRYLPLCDETVRPVDVLDFRALSFTYDTLLPELAFGQPMTSQELSQPGDEQGFRIIVQDAGRYRIEKQGTTDTVVGLYGPDNWDLRLQASGPGMVPIVADLTLGTYYVVVRHTSPTGTGTFSLSLRQEDIIIVPPQPPEPPTTPEPLEPTNIPIQLIVDSSPIEASIGEGGEVDVYRFTVPTLGQYTIETEGPTDVIMSLYGPDDRNSLVTEDDDSGQEFNAKISSRLTAGTYYVEVHHYFPTRTGLYSISVQAEAEAIPELEVNGPEVQSEIGVANESDLYTFSVTEPGNYTIETSGPTDTFLTLYGPDSETTVISRDDDSGPGLLSRIEQPLEEGTYYVRVRHYSPTETGPYGILVRR